jgi:hypothetical protein
VDIGIFSTLPSNQVQDMAAKLKEAELKELLAILQARFQQNLHRHKGVDWKKLETKLRSQADKCRTLFEMERSGGEPDVAAYDAKTDLYTFMDCAVESPKERRSWCYDRAALDKRKENKPANDAMTAIQLMGAEILTEDDYRYLQTLGKFDLKTSSWILTPPAIRKLGGALFCDRRYDTVFTYHNGAESYYAARGVRGKVKI